MEERCESALFTGAHCAVPSSAWLHCAVQSVRRDALLCCALENVEIDGDGDRDGLRRG